MASVSSAAEYLTENDVYSAPPALRDAAEYLTEHDVYATTAGNIASALWSVYPTRGAIGDHLFIYGQGLSTGVTVTMDTGPEVPVSYYTDDASSVALSVVGYTSHAATGAAYGSSRDIISGTDSAPLSTNVEYGVLEVVILSSPVGSETAPDNTYLQARSSAGLLSDRIPFLYYHRVGVDVATGPSSNRDGAGVRILPGLPFSTGIPQHAATFDPARGYTVIAGLLEDIPDHLTSSASTFTFTTGTPTEGTSDPVGLPIDGAKRWRPLTEDLVPRTDLGTGVSLWTPLSGSTQNWKVVADTAPYIDPAWSIPSAVPQSPITRPAMVFPLGAYAQSTDPMPFASSQAAWTLVMAVQVHAPQGAIGTIFSTYGSGSGQHISIGLRGDRVFLHCGAYLANVGVASDYLNKRPIILGLTTFHTSGNQRSLFNVVTRSIVESWIAHPSIPNAAHAYLGAGPLGDNQMRMEILDMTLQPNLAYSAVRALIGAYNSAYAVIRR